MTTKKTARKYSSPVIGELLHEITSVEKEQCNTKMMLAARLDDILTERNLGKSEFAKKVNKNPSEITKWLSGTHNFTVDILTEIAMALNLTLSDFFAPKQVQVVNKINLVFNVKVQESSIKYVTPLGDIVNSNETYYSPWQIQSFPHLLTSLKA